MKRILTGVVLIAALAIPAAPAVAHGGHHKRAHKARHHVVFHKRAHHRLTISDAGDPKVADRIGTIASFADGVLTITLDGGKTIEGAVTDATEIKIQTLPAPTTTTARASHNEGDDDHGDDNRGDSFGDYPGSSGDYPGDGGDHHGRCHRGDDTTDGTTTDLVAGAVVGEVEIGVTKDGLVFREIKLVKS